MADILIVNGSALISAADIAPAIAAINRQVATDFAPAWNVPGTVYAADAPAGAWRFSLQDTIDDAGDLGYHVDGNGAVSAIIDVAACRDSGNDWRTCLSHEVLEALADPLTSRLAPNGIDIVEVCDPVEEDGYVIDGIPVSNFVLPAYFGWAGTQFDHLARLTMPAPALRPGGYIMRYEGGQWVTTYGDRAAVQPGFMASRRTGRRAWRVTRGARQA